MFRKTSGAILCPSCGRLTNADAPSCLVCGRRNPGMWGFAGPLRALFRRAELRGRRSRWRASCSTWRASSSTSGGRCGHAASSTFLAEHRVRCGRSARPGRSPGSRPVVDPAHRDLPARQRAPHPVQRAVDPTARARRRAALRPGAARHDLHGGRASSVSWPRTCFGLPLHDRGLGLDLRAARRDGRVRSEARRHLRRDGPPTVRPVGIVLFVLGFMMQGVNNIAHAGGFVGGLRRRAWCWRWPSDARRPHSIGCWPAAIVLTLARLRAGPLRARSIALNAQTPGTQYRARALW